MPAPLLKLHGGLNALLTADKSLAGQGLWTSTPPPGLTDTVQVLALGSDPDPAILKPGDSGRIPVYYRGCKQPWDFSYPAITFDLGVVAADDDTPVDWTSVEQQVRPSGIPDADWDPLWLSATAGVGLTQGQLVQTLSQVSSMRGGPASFEGMLKYALYLKAQSSGTTLQEVVKMTRDAPAPTMVRTFLFIPRLFLERRPLS